MHAITAEMFRAARPTLPFADASVDVYCYAGLSTYSARVAPSSRSRFIFRELSSRFALFYILMSVPSVTISMFFRAP